MLQVGQLLHDRYHLQQKLGHNAGRQTWLAADLQDQAQPVVIKLLAFSEEMQWEDFKLFEREVQILRQVRHSQIPTYRDYFSMTDRISWFALVYDYIPGVSLRQMIDEGKRFAEDDVRRIAIAMLKILTDLHQLNPPILHRDIKPSNVILGHDDSVYLVDFGAVQGKAATEGATFTVVGTYGYTPMEQFGGRAVAASDLYALGATLVHLLTGVSPADLPQRQLRIQFRDRTSITSRFADWLDRLIAPAIEERFNNAPDALQELTQPTLPVPSGFGQIERPRNTKVQVKRQRDSLEIIIPAYSKRDSAEFAVRRSAGVKAILFWFITVFATMVLLVVTLLLLFYTMFGIAFSGNERLFLTVGWWVLVALLLVTGGVFFALNLPRFRRTRLAFTRKKFHLEEQHFRSTTSRITGSTPDIRHVWRDAGQIVISSGPYRHGYRNDRFGEELTDFERVWLTREIRSWLKLRMEEE